MKLMLESAVLLTSRAAFICDLLARFGTLEEKVCCMVKKKKLQKTAKKCLLTAIADIRCYKECWINIKFFYGFQKKESLFFYIPATKISYGVQQIFSAGFCNFFYTSANSLVRERKRPDVGHTAGDGDAGQVIAGVESIVPNARNAGRDRDAAQTGAARECIRLEDGDAAGDRDVAET